MFKVWLLSTFPFLGHFLYLSSKKILTAQISGKSAQSNAAFALGVSSWEKRRSQFQRIVMGSASARIPGFKSR
jgi:hypothetical protein